MTFITHGFQWYRTYERGHETSGSPLRFMLRRSSLVECVSVLHGTCLQSVKKKNYSSVYVQPCLSKNPKYTFYTIKSSLTLAYYLVKSFVVILINFNSWMQLKVFLVTVFYGR
jgi:hypothetical protein